MKQNICSMAYTLEIITWLDLEKKILHVLASCFCIGLTFSSPFIGLAIAFLSGHFQGCQAVTWLKFSVESRWNVEDSFEWSFFYLENK